MKQVYVPKEEITTYPDGWNGEDWVYLGKYWYDSFNFLNDPREDIYSLDNEMSKLPKR